MRDGSTKPGEADIGRYLILVNEIVGLSESESVVLRFITYEILQASARAVSNSLSSNTASAQLNSNNKQINPSAVDSRSSSVSRSEGSSTVGSNRMTATPLLSSNAFPEPTSFADSGGSKFCVF